MENIISTIYIIPQKKLVKSAVLFFVGLTALYLFLLGSIFSHIEQKKELSVTLEKESQALYALEESVSRERIGLNSFLELGYAESHKFEIIKTARNVASIQTPHY
ncbi:MAG TPA: hypothetical protein VJH05_00110 [Candidatus Paceibacterota bacterium]